MNQHLHIKEKAWKIFEYSFPILVMIALIPLIQDDKWLAFFYLVIITASFLIKKDRNDVKIFIFGFIMMTIFESIFISTGVETFERISLFGLMPLWLPFIWGYGFVVISRSIKVLENK